MAIVPKDKLIYHMMRTALEEAITSEDRVVLTIKGRGRAATFNSSNEDDVVANKLHVMMNPLSKKSRTEDDL